MDTAIEEYMRVHRSECVSASRHNLEEDFTVDCITQSTVKSSFKLQTIGIDYRLETTVFSLDIDSILVYYLWSRLQCADSPRLWFNAYSLYVYDFARFQHK